MRTSLIPIKKVADYNTFFRKCVSRRNVLFRVSYYVGQYVTRVCQYAVLGRKTNTETCVYVGLNRGIHFGWQPLGRKSNH